MKEVFQDRVSTTTGDCIRASLASLLELPLKSVPDFTAPINGSPEPAKDWFVRLQTWLKGRGLFFLEIRLTHNMPWNPMIYPAECIFFGKSANGTPHAVVGRVEGDQFVQVFNPSPQGAGIDKVDSICFLCPLSPSKLQPKSRHPPRS